MGCRLWGRTESDTTEATQQHQQQLLVSGLPRWLGSIHLARQEMQEAELQSPGQEDPLEEGMATCSSFLPWRIPWTEPGGLQSIASQELDTTEAT